ncbi:MAG TPA: ATP-binding cassette domain-containing protein, partial [Actinomycetota bacterium]|nr:ATP-binding cassette domain-containing protein [Actinomycetota bacterium]
EGMELKDVSFKYPGTESYVLQGVNLSLPAGSTVAVVGDNGAGKTTLIKLLCRFYRPTEGQILADGSDIDRFEPEQWRSRMSAGFQDFARFEFQAGEVVGVGDIPQIDDGPTLERALARGGATDVITALPLGMNTQLGKSFDEGVELSGGQWQKLALGRSMMRDPLLLVLDEPTASLDANAEHALFERFAAASERAARTSGAITVLVSHRFSTVRMADLIVVVEAGRVLEIGSHKELLDRKGLYADLFEMQARGYR